MQETKKSLSAQELAQIIQKLKANKVFADATREALMAEIRKKYTFSKAKWTEAKSLLDKGKTPAKPTAKPTAKPKKETLVSVSCEICCSSDGPNDQIGDEFFTALDTEDDNAEDFVLQLFAFCKEHPNDIFTLDICPAAHPSLYRVLNKAVETGLLKEMHGYMLGDSHKKNKPCKRAVKKGSRN